MLTTRMPTRRTVSCPRISCSLSAVSDFFSYASRMRWIDGHLDLAYLAVSGRDLTRPVADRTTGCISLPELVEAGVDTCFGTIYTELGAPGTPHGYRDASDREGAHTAGLRQLEVYETLETFGHLKIARTRADLQADAPIRIVLLMEGADPIRTPDEAAFWVERGVRLVGLTWARGSRYAGGNGEPHGPLTPTGRELIAELDRLGVVHDVSHLSDEAADAVLDATSGPIVATHSNARAAMDGEAGRNQRHLRDDHLRAIAQRDGIVGLNLYGSFLSTGPRAAVTDCLRHLEHIEHITGSRRFLALGSDMDGGFPPTSLPVDLDHPSKLGALAEAMRRAGWSDDELHGFAHRNWARLLERALPRSRRPD